jgi:hypothetical protein
VRKPTAKKIAEKKSLHPKKLRKPRKDRGQPRENYNPKSKKNLKPYTKGVSGNPSGMPGYDVAARIARRIFQLNEEAIYRAQGEELLEGGAYNFSVLAERGFGKVKDKHELSGPEGEPIKLLVKVIKPSLKDMA